jgi:hypothetical protein
MAKTGRKVVSLGREAHILAQLDFMFLYINFYGFYQKIPNHSKNLPKIHIFYL